MNKYDKPLYWKYQMGYEHEGTVLDALKDAGLAKYIVYANPRNKWQWLRRKGHGVDIRLCINGQYINLECSYQSHYYRYKASWFLRDRLPRFADLTGTNILLVENSRNFLCISNLINSYNVMIHTITTVITYLISVIPNTINTVNTITHNTVYTHGNQLDSKVTYNLSWYQSSIAKWNKS